MDDSHLFDDFIIQPEPETEKPEPGLLDLGLPPLPPSGDLKKSKKKQKDESEKSQQSQFSGDTQELLQQSAREANLKKAIHDQEIKGIKLEREKIGLLKDAGEVGEISFFEFCFVSYMEKMNIDSFKMIDRLETRIKAYANENKGEAIVVMLKKELTNVIKGVKIAQSNEVKRWIEQ